VLGSSLVYAGDFSPYRGFQLIQTGDQSIFAIILSLKRPYALMQTAIAKAENRKGIE
jgi:hypothetical protein